MPQLITTLGTFEQHQLGTVLPHEHIFVDLSPITVDNWRKVAVSDVLPVMVPCLEEAKKVGISAIVECTPVGVGRRAEIVRAVSEAARLPVLVPTGIYREPWVPQWAHDASLDDLRDWMVGELEGTIEESGVQAGWIKLSAGDDGLTDVERKILIAAAQAGKATNAVIGSHTIRGQVVLDQLRVIEDAGYDAGRFIWIHTQAEPDFNLQLEVARRGAWLEYDAIGGEWVPEEYFLEQIPRIVDAGFGRQLLLSHDRGWYDPSLPGGGAQQPYTYLSEEFIPKLIGVGLADELIRQLTCDNPFRAFAR